jgi:hypothetical protein
MSNGTKQAHTNSKKVDHYSDGQQRIRIWERAKASLGKGAMQRLKKHVNKSRQEW